MDWSPTEMQTAVKDLARQILSDDAENWDAVVEAGLLDVEELPETLTLLVEAGRSGARVPLLETLVLGWPARGVDLPEGSVLTAGLIEAASPDPLRATTTSQGDRLTGRKTCVPALDRAARVVVPTADGVWLVDPSQAEVQVQTGTNGDALGVLVLDGTPAERLGSRELLEAWLPRIHLGIAALQLGLGEQALALTSSHVRERKQFGMPIGAFQAVHQRAADAWIDLQCIDVALWRAAWLLDTAGPTDPQTARAVRIARYWAADGGHRVVAAAQHLHGGFGFDRDYPLHRYFLTFKAWEQVLGGANVQLSALGDLLAASA